MKTSESEWVVAAETAGPGLAEILCGLLEACNIEARMSQEGAWQAIPLTVGILGTAQVLVRQQDLAQAQAVIADFYANRIFPTSTSDDGTDSSSAAEESPEDPT